MNATNIIYPQYWLNLHAKDMFWGHLALLKAQFKKKRFIGLEIDRVKILALLDEKKLDLTIFLFKITL
jgi:hypothetical protein